MRASSLFIHFILLVLFVFATVNCSSASSGSDEEEFSTYVLDGRAAGCFGDLKSTEVRSSGSEYTFSPSSGGTLAAAISSLKPGDTLILEDGTYKERLSLGSAISGSANNYIQIKARNPGNAIISGNNASQNEYHILTCAGAAYVKISGLTFADVKSSSGGAGVCVYPPSHHLIIENCTFRGIRTPSPTASGHTANGIICFGSSVSASINNIFIKGNSFSDMATGWGECITVSANCENVNIVSNSINGTGNIGIDVGGNYRYCSDPAKDFARNVYIAYNTVKNCKSPNASCASIYADGGQHIIIENNTVSDGQVGIVAGAEQRPPKESYSTGDILIRNNNIEGFKNGAFHCGGWQKGLGWVKGVRFTGNTCRNNGNKSDGAVVVIDKCRDVEVSGNTFSNSGKFVGTDVYYTFGNESEYTKNVTITSNKWDLPRS